MAVPSLELPVPDLPGVLGAEQVRETAAWIARVQEPSGAVPWFRGGHVDVWDHVECAMALLVAGEPEAAERAYRWLFENQRPDGSWPLKLSGGRVVDHGTDSNMTAYVAVGVWHHWLACADERFLRRAWPVVRRALDRVARLQLPFGGVAWAQGAEGPPADTALVAASSSVLQAFGCGMALAELVDQPQPGWEHAAGRLRHALCDHERSFDDRRRYSMDWYYPVLAGALRGASALDRLRERWDDFVVPDLGIRCVEDHPWVTGAETCELVLALDAVGWREEAAEMLAAMQHLRDPDGSYWTGYVFADGARWPVERSTWTAAAVVLAVDALSGATPAAGLFRDARLPDGFTGRTRECGCDAVGASVGSVDRVPGSAPHPD